MADRKTKPSNPWLMGQSTTIARLTGGTNTATNDSLSAANSLLQNENSEKQREHPSIPLRLCTRCNLSRVESPLQTECLLCTNAKGELERSMQAAVAATGGNTNNFNNIPAPPPSPRQPQLSPQEEEALMNAWAQAMPRKRMLGGAKTPQETMDRLGVTATFVQGLETGDWNALTRRLRQAGNAVCIKNVPPLQAGEHVEIQAGNSIGWEWVGCKGMLVEYQPKTNKWRVRLDSGPVHVVNANNLLRVEQPPQQQYLQQDR